MNVAIMLISFLALVALLDMLLGWIHMHNGLHWIPGSLGEILGYVFWPVAWLIGVPAQDCSLIGNLLGTRMALNEVIAYIALGAHKATLMPQSLPPSPHHGCCPVRFHRKSRLHRNANRRHRRSLVPERRNDLAQLGIRAMLAGTMANLISASIAGMFLG